MKKKLNGKKIISLLLALTLCFGTVMIPSQEVKAASPAFYATDVKVTLFKSSQTTYGYYVLNPTKKDKITNIKVKDKKILSASRSSDTKYCLLIVPKKAGTTKITFKYGKKTFSMKVTVKNWSSPCKSFKLGNKDYSSKFKNHNYYFSNKPSKSKKVKISIKGNKNWKVDYISYFNGKTSKQIKNNSTIKITSKKNYSYITVRFYNSKTMEYEYITLYTNR